jgi:AsmA protein
MATIIKRLLISVVSLILLLVIAVAIMMMVIDPNDYKTDIVKAAHDKGGINLQINGDIGWSFMPLGLEINQVKILDQNNTTFTQLKHLTAAIDLFSLFKMKPRVQKILVDGLDLRLTKNKAGEGNWTDLIATKKSATPTIKQTSPTKTPAKPENKNATPHKAIDFKVDDISIINTQVSYNDAQTGQSVQLKDFNLITRNITLDHAFPLHIDFIINNQSPKLNVKAKLNANITLGNDLKHFQVSDLKSNYEVSGAPLGEKTLQASLNNNHISVNLNKQTANIDKLILKAANLTVKANLSVSELDKSPKLSGSVDIPPFSAQDLLVALGHKKIVTRSPTALTSIGFKTNIASPAGDYDLNNIQITLDKTTYTGNLAFTQATKKLLARLNGTTLDVDDYLPPKPKQDKVSKAIAAADQLKAAANKKAAPVEKAPPANPNAPLLPLKTLRALNMDIAFTQQKLIVKHLKINDIKATFKASKGLINLEEVSAKLYEGTVFASGQIDARTDNVKWHIVKKVQNVQTMPLLNDAAGINYISGGINASVILDSLGNTLDALRNHAKGEVDFHFDKAMFHGINLDALACQGVAMIPPKQSVNTSNWPAETPLNSLKGHANINGNIVDNTLLQASASGLTLTGKGTVNLAKSFIHYETDLNITGDLGSNQCKVNDRLKQIPIPVLCEGSFDTPPTKLCKLDYSKISGVIKKMAKAEFNAKKHEAEKKAREKIKQKIDEKLKDKFGQDAKKLFKGLF